MRRGGYLQRRTPLRSSSRLETRTPIKRKPMRRGPGKTAHARREREFGFMMFCRERGCELALDHELQRLIGISHDCSFEPVEFAHLHDRRRYAPGDIGAGLCVTTHRGIDGRLGGKLPWYAALDHVGQHTFRMRLANRARAAWDALSDEERTDWERRAAEWRASLRRAA